MFIAFKQCGEPQVITTVPRLSALHKQRVTAIQNKNRAVVRYVCRVLGLVTIKTLS